MTIRRWKLARGLIVPDHSLVPHSAGPARQLAGFMHYRMNVQDGYAAQAQTAEFRILESAGDSSSILTGGTPSASSQATGYEASKAFDGSTSTTHRNASNAFPYTLTYQIASRKHPGVFSLNSGGGFGTLHVESSNDGANWDRLATLDSSIAVLGPSVFGTANAWYWPLLDHEMWMLYVSSVQGGGASVTIYEWELRATPGGSNLLTGGRPTAKSAYSSGTAPSLMFDGSNSTYWQNSLTYDPTGSGTTWCGYILPRGARINPVEMRIKIVSTTSAPKDMVLKRYFEGVYTTYWSTSATGWTNNQNRLFSIP